MQSILVYEGYIYNKEQIVTTTHIGDAKGENAKEDSYLMNIIR
jgi:hypothetical protein